MVSSFLVLIFLRLLLLPFNHQGQLLVFLRYLFVSLHYFVNYETDNYEDTRSYRQNNLKHIIHFSNTELWLFVPLFVKETSCHETLISGTTDTCFPVNSTGNLESAPRFLVTVHQFFKVNCNAAFFQAGDNIGICHIQLEFLHVRQISPVAEVKREQYAIFLVDFHFGLGVKRCVGEFF